MRRALLLWSFALIGLGSTVFVTKRSLSAARVRDSWSRFSQCLIGPPLASHEKFRLGFGVFPEKATFGEGRPGEVVLTSAGATDVFFARYDRTGTLIWAGSAGGQGEDWGRDIVRLESGGAVVVGNIASTASVFGKGSSNEVTLVPEAQDAFIARYEL